MTGEMDDQRPRAPAWRRSEHKRRDLVTSVEIVADRPYHLALLDDNIRLEAGFVQDLADRRADHAFDPEALLLLDRRLDPAELNEVLRFDDSEHLDSAPGLGRAPGGEAQ